MTAGDHRRRKLRLAGIAGIVGAICWTLGDMATVGENAHPGDYPLLLIRYADRIDFGGLSLMLPASEPRLAFGALIADLAIPLYLIGSWHLFQAVKPAGPLTAWTVFALLICGNAYSPLGHAAFYFVGMLYKTIPIMPEAAHPALLDLGNRFHHVLMIAWVAAVGCLAFALLLLGIAIARGRTAYPRWVALLLNPVSLVLVGMVVPYLTPEPMRTWLGGAGFNLGWLVAYGVSTAVLWRAKPIPMTLS